MSIDPDSYKLLEKESGEINWSELQPHFARGVVVNVSKDHDLIVVAIEFVNDNKKIVAEMLADGGIVRVTDEMARVWSEGDPLMKSVVVAPWVLVQEICVS